MPAIQRSEFALALNQVASERGVDVSIVLETVRNAILAAYRKDHPEAANVEEGEEDTYTAELNPNTGEAHILHNGDDVTPPGFGRIAAQTAKQVILQKIREKEKEAIMSDFRDRMGTIANGMVLRFAGPNIIIDIGKTEAIMPPQEQIQSENYRLNQRMSVYISEIREGMRGEELIVSRSATGLIAGLFKREVPEVAQGSVEIKAIVREAGNRTKIAVFSNQSGIDPVGSCVGQKGVRVQAIIQEFNGMEKIDIIQWVDDSKLYIAQALSPAKDVRVEINEEDKIAHVFVPQEELSLAIGKDGQNVRLASKLTGYRIEIEGKGGAPVAAPEEIAVEEPINTAEVAIEETVEEPVEDTVDNTTTDTSASTADEANLETNEVTETPSSEIAESGTTEESDVIEAEKLEKAPTTEAPDETAADDTALTEDTETKANENQG